MQKAGAGRPFIYLNTGWVGRPRPPVRAKIGEVLANESRSGGASPQFLQYAREIQEEAIASVAGLLGVPSEYVFLSHGTSDALLQGLLHFRWRNQGILALSSIEHASVQKVCRTLAMNVGIGIKELNIDPARSDKDIVAATVDQIPPATQLAVVSHVDYATGRVLPIIEIADALHSSGVKIAVDGAQAAGHVPIAETVASTDIYAISGQKWLQGPQGTGALIVSKGRALSSFVLPESKDLTGHHPALLAGFGVACRLAVDRNLVRTATSMQSILKLRDEANTFGYEPSLHREFQTRILSLRLPGANYVTVRERLINEFHLAVRSVSRIQAVRLCIDDEISPEDISYISEALQHVAVTRQL